MPIIAWLRHVLGLSKRHTTPVLSKIANPRWAGSEGTYVSRFKKTFNEIARALSQETKLPVQARFNEHLSRAELGVPLGDVFAQVSITGECSTATDVTVFAFDPLTRDMEDYFRIAFGLPVKVIRRMN